jgi:uncharacterized protein YecE (DUF72 family)
VPQTRIGISGWTYPPWRRVFYPDGLPHRRELEFASRQVGSIVINGTFYALQRPESFRAWVEQTPDQFVFSVKGGRFITHLKKLRDVDTALANFFACGVLALGPKLGPLLWQLPPNFGYDAERVEAFLSLLPHTTAVAAELAAQHDDRVDDRAWVTTDADRPVRHAIEVRHASYETPSFLALLRAHGVAAVTADTAGKWPMIEEQTADFSYVRLHGAEELYSSGYSDEGLDTWAAKVRAWGQDRDVFVYFDNDVKVHAPFDAMGLMRRLGLDPEGDAQ